MTAAPAAFEVPAPDVVPASITPPRRSRRRPTRIVRSVLFWTHLAVGVLTGIVVLVMSATGTALTFQRQILDWSVSRHMAAPGPAAQRLPLDTLLARARATLPPDQSISTVTVKPDPGAPVTLGLGARRYAYVNPYTGELLPANDALQTFYFEMERWHRSMAMGEGLRGRPGVTITGAANLGFLFLIVSGVFLWIPRRFSWHAVRAVLLFEPGVRGRRRDWNWHHVLGIWSMPVLFLLVLSGVFISYQWPGAMLERAFGERAAASSGAGRGGRGGGGGGSSEIALAPGMSLELVAARAAAQVDGWESIQIRPPRSMDAPITATVSTTSAVRPDARTSLSFDQRTAEMSVQPGYASLGTAQRLRSWVRGVHTGEAAGSLGQALAGLACLAAVMLVWTGIALAWRRFLRAVRPRRRYATV